MTSVGRIIPYNQVVLDQADFLQSNGFSRVVGLTTADVTGQLFFNNVVQPWPLISGVGVADSQVVSGRVYFSEVSGSPGFYSVRLRPNALGYWRLILIYTAGMQQLAQDYDVVQNAPATTQGLNASLIKSGSGGCC